MSKAWLFGVAFLAACSSGDAPAPANAASGEVDRTHAALAPALVERVQSAIGAERRVRLVWHAENPWLDQWIVGVDGDGRAEFGYAETICMTLHDLGAVDDFTEVQIVEARLARAAGGVDVVEKSKISGVRCRDDQRLTAWPPQRLPLTAS